MDDDNAVWRLAQAGSESMFAELVRRYERPLFAFLARCMGDLSLAEDLFQETFVKVYENRQKYSGRGSFKAWLYAIALNLCRDRKRKDLRDRGGICLPAEDEKGSVSTSNGNCLKDSSAIEPADDVAETETACEVRDAVADLPREYGEVVIMRLYQELTFEEIAQITGKPVGTLKSRMFYALRKLRPGLTRIVKAGGYLR